MLAKLEQVSNPGDGGSGRQYGDVVISFVVVRIGEDDIDISGFEARELDLNFGSY